MAGQTNIFHAEQFIFPYQYKFPGQATDEKILFVTRENPVMLWWRRLLIVVVGVVVVITGLLLVGLLRSNFNLTVSPLFIFAVFALGAIIMFVGWWWTTMLWKKSIGIVTTKRLTKFIYTTPINRHNLSLPLEMIVDTGSYTKGFLPAIFRLSTFTARSSASSSGVATDDTDRINKKYFYLENIAIAEDLQHYVSKLLDSFHHKKERLDKFRPFIPKLKGDARKEFMKQYPEYWS